MKVNFTSHAIFEMKRRYLSEELIRRVIEHPEQHWEIRKGRFVYQTRVKMDIPEKDYLVRVFLDTDREPPEVVTAYRTSKIEKYWRD